MNFIEATKHCLQNYANFSGRAPRSEYWFFALFTFISMIVASVIDSAILGGAGVINLLVTLGLLLPGIAAGVRRLHDGGRSGWWYLLILIPLIGPLVLLFWFVQKGDSAANEYGGDPLSGTAAPAQRAI